MQGAKITARLPNVPGAAHDREADQAPAWRKGLASRDRCQPEEERSQCEAITQELRGGETETVGELAEDAQGAEADSRPDDERDADRASIRRGRPHPAILGSGRYWTMTGV